MESNFANGLLATLELSDDYTEMDGNVCQEHSFILLNLESSLKRSDFPSDRIKLFVNGRIKNEGEDMVEWEFKSSEGLVKLEYLFLDAIPIAKDTKDGSVKLIIKGKSEKHLELAVTISNNSQEGDLNDYFKLFDLKSEASNIKYHHKLPNVLKELPKGDGRISRQRPAVAMEKLPVDSSYSSFNNDGVRWEDGADDDWTDENGTNVWNRAFKYVSSFWLVDGGLDPELEIKLQHDQIETLKEKNRALMEASKTEANAHASFLERLGKALDLSIVSSKASASEAEQLILSEVENLKQSYFGALGLSLKLQTLLDDNSTAGTSLTQRSTSPARTLDSTTSETSLTINEEGQSKSPIRKQSNNATQIQGFSKRLKDALRSNSTSSSRKTSLNVKQQPTQPDNSNEAPPPPPIISGRKKTGMSVVDMYEALPDDLSWRQWSQWLQKEYNNNGLNSDSNES